MRSGNPRRRRRPCHNPTLAPATHALAAAAISPTDPPSTALAAALAAFASALAAFASALAAAALAAAALTVATLAAAALAP